MDDNLPDVVRDYKLTTWYDGNVTIHLHDDPDAPPSSPPRQERWKKVRTLGHGGQGDIVLETCIDGGRNFTQRAVKKIRFQDSDSKRRYQRELATIVKFSHDKYSKYFVKSLGWYASSSKLYIAMEYLPAGDLCNFVRERQHLPEDDGREITSQILSGIALMHAERFSHRDIKPQNILIHRHPGGIPSGSWWVKLADFGISKRLGPNTNVTSVSIGTELYMAPELLRPGKIRHPTNDYRAADVWALGITVFFILTNSFPFENTSSTMKYAENQGETFPQGPLDCCQVSEDGQVFLRQVMRPHPEARVALEAAMHHSWIGNLLPGIRISGEHSRPSTVSSRRSSFDNGKGLTSEISRLASQSDLTGPSTRVPRTIEQTRHQTPEQDDRAVIIIEHETNGSLTEVQPQSPMIEHPVVNEDDDSWEQLMTAYRNGNVELIKAILNIDVDLHTSNNSILMPLPPRIHEQDWPLNLDDNIANAQDWEGRTPIILAAIKGHTLLAEFLIQKGSNLQHFDRRGMTPLMHAVRHGHEPITKVFLDHGVDVDRQPCCLFTPLILAARGGHEVIARLLIAAGADLEEGDGVIDTPLTCAARQGHVAIAKLLLERGAKIDRGYNNGFPQLKI
ncbi:hypothetical protein FSST1_006545 [Fusarium sambucinum]